MAGFRNTTKGTIAANDASVTLEYRHHTNGAVGVQVTGTFSGTLQFEISLDGTTYVAVQAVNVTSGAATTTTTATGVFRFEAVGAWKVRVRSTAWSSGTATVTLVALDG